MKTNNWLSDLKKENEKEILKQQAAKIRQTQEREDCINRSRAELEQTEKKLRAHAKSCEIASSLYVFCSEVLEGNLLYQEAGCLIERTCRGLRSDNGSVTMAHTRSAKMHFYIKTGATGFSSPPSSEARISAGKLERGGLLNKLFKKKERIYDEASFQIDWYFRADRDRYEKDGLKYYGYDEVYLSQFRWILSWKHHGSISNILNFIRIDATSNGVTIANRANSVDRAVNPSNGDMFRNMLKNSFR